MNPEAILRYYWKSLWFLRFQELKAWIKSKEIKPKSFDDDFHSLVLIDVCQMKKFHLRTYFLSYLVYDPQTHEPNKPQKFFSQKNLHISKWSEIKRSNSISRPFVVLRRSCQISHNTKKLNSQVKILFTSNKRKNYLTISFLKRKAPILYFGKKEDLISSTFALRAENDIGK